MATTIPANQAKAQFTKDLVDVFMDQLPATSFLRSLFPSEQSFVRFLSIEVERDAENVAVDVMRGTEGARNKFSITTEKVIDPPYYREYFDLTDLTLYDRLFGSTAIDAGVYSQLLQIASRRLGQLRDKIERAYEKQCAEILELGTVTLVNATSINFGRKSGSLVANGGSNNWATSGVDPFANFEDACVFLRTIGKAPDATFNAILGKTAHQNLQNNDVYQKKVIQNLNNNIDNINAPQRGSTGYAFHGTLSAGSFRVNLFTYPQYYDLSGTATPYVNDKKVTVIPENPRFKLGFAAVPQLIRTGNGGAEDAELPTPVAAPYVVGDYVDPRLTAHIMDIKSAGVAIPTAIDQMYTFQPVA